LQIGFKKLRTWEAKKGDMLSSKIVFPSTTSAISPAFWASFGKKLRIRLLKLIFDIQFILIKLYIYIL